MDKLIKSALKFWRGNPTLRYVVFGLLAAAAVYWFGRLSARQRDERRAEKAVEQDAEEQGLDPRRLASDASGLRSAMEGWGTNEEAIYAILGRYRDPDHFALLELAYFNAFARNLVQDLTSELDSGELEQIAYIYG